MGFPSCDAGQPCDLLFGWGTRPRPLENRYGRCSSHAVDSYRRQINASGSPATRRMIVVSSTLSGEHEVWRMAAMANERGRIESKGALGPCDGYQHAGDLSGRLPNRLHGARSGNGGGEPQLFPPAVDSLSFCRVSAGRSNGLRTGPGWPTPVRTKESGISGCSLSRAVHLDRLRIFEMASRPILLVCRRKVSDCGPRAQDERCGVASRRVELGLRGLVGDFVLLSPLACQCSEQVATAIWGAGISRNALLAH